MQLESNISIQYEISFKGIPVRPGTFIYLKGMYEPVEYECLLHNMATDKSYLVVRCGNERRKYPVSFLRGVLNLKRSRKNDNN